MRIKKRRQISSNLTELQFQKSGADKPWISWSIKHITILKDDIVLRQVLAALKAVT